MLYDIYHSLLKTDIPGLPAPHRGKVRDVYDLGETLLFVATDRISAFDCVMPNGIPEKGHVLTQLTLAWLKFFDQYPNHLITADVNEYPSILKPFAKDLEGRSMIVKKLRMVPVECVVRGYLAGSGWKEYQALGSVNGIPLRKGYTLASKLDEPIFTPSTKAATGHDIAVSCEELCRQFGDELTYRLKSLAIELYSTAADYAKARGIIIADTKFEFGLDEQGRLIIADEVLTPDSSRFWPVESYAVGSNPPSLDKQFVRDWLDSVHFNHQPPAPELPPEVVRTTTGKYLSALSQLNQ